MNLGSGHNKRIELIYCNAGGGHRAAAIALDAVIREQRRPWSVRLVNLFEVLDPKRLFRRATGLDPEDLYNKRLAHGWTFGLAHELRLLQALIRASHRTLHKRLQRHWRESMPDMVVSLVPNFNRVMFESATSALPHVVYATVLTDLADFPPHFWIEPNQAQHLICGTPRAVHQARSAGYAPAVIHETSGMIVRPDFYHEARFDKNAELRRLNLDPTRPTGLVMFGGHGSRLMHEIAARLGDTQLIMICGHNTSLAAKLQSTRSSAPRHIVGFTQNVRRYMAVSDYFIGKPGPGSISEALQQRLPVIVVRNACTMPQERYNTDWVRENRVGLVLNSFATIREAVAEVTGKRDVYRQNIAAIDNQAIFEIPEIFAKLFSRQRLNLQNLARDFSRTRA